MSQDSEQQNGAGPKFSAQDWEDLRSILYRCFHDHFKRLTNLPRTGLTTEEMNRLHNHLFEMDQEGRLPVKNLEELRAYAKTAAKHRVVRALKERNYTRSIAAPLASGSGDGPPLMLEDILADPHWEPLEQMIYEEQEAALLRLLGALKGRIQRTLQTDSQRSVYQLWVAQRFNRDGTVNPKGVSIDAIRQLTGKSWHRVNAWVEEWDKMLREAAEEWERHLRPQEEAP